MNIYETKSIKELIENNSYVGRGIIIGKSEDSKKAVIAYFIMGRSENSRNRFFVEKEDEVIVDVDVNPTNDTCTNTTYSGESTLIINPIRLK